MFEINTLLLQYLNNLSQYKIVEDFVFLFADLPIFFLPIFLISNWCYCTWRKKDIQAKEKLILIFYACVIGLCISLIIQQFIQLDRPEAALSNSGRLILSHIPDASFPSDHATISFAFLVSLFFTGYKKVFWCFLPLVLAMNISRIIGGIHWPLDILVGSIIGSLAAFYTHTKLKEIKFVKTLNSRIITILSYLRL